MKRYSKQIPETAIKYACDVIGVKHSQLKIKSRVRPLSDARHIIMHYLRHQGIYSLPTIGAYFNRDHTSVIMGVRKVNRLLTCDDEFTQKYLTVKRVMDNIIANAA